MDTSFCSLPGILTNFDKQLVALPRRFDHPLSASTVEFFLTTACNKRCDYCFSYHTGDPQTMSSEVALAFLEGFFFYQSEHNIQHELFQFVFSGGEPTLNSTTLFAILDYLDAKDIDVLPMILTNGHISPALLEKLIEANICFQVSYNEKNNSLRLLDRPELNSPAETIKSVVEAGLPVTILSVISAENVHKMPQIVEFAAHNSIDSVLFKPIRPLTKTGNISPNIVKRATPEDYVKNYYLALETAQKLKINLPRIELSRFRTRGSRKELPKLFVYPDGQLSSMTASTAVTKPGMENDVIGKTEIVSQSLKLDLDQIKKNISIFLDNSRRLCRGCSCFKYCRGRTFDNYYYLVATENLSTLDEHVCEITRKLYQEMPRYSESVAVN